ncbi:FAD-dependent monooxygenase [Nocardia aurantia]|uniref:FAD-binding domain-containing protein n=1 Tax=Nocardia aurantia TaxID=2585199 RepID=A0A7K0DX84_9NOCA|nr:FAD-dependent monooxygenase [Nocardia aurantia]MQY30403.1 hypothetical protein [Nocardia aurantia]
MSTTHVLIAGGGIAGNALALQLLRAGVQVTVVERAEAPRPGGQAVDLRGPSKEAAERMGLLPGIRRHQLHELGLVYVDGSGREYARMSMESMDGTGPVAEIEITRGDLNQVLLDEIAKAGDPDYRYGDWIEAIEQNPEGADVTFASGRTGRYDLVVAADGVHSATRRLAFGPEERFATYLEGYCAFFTIPTPAGIEPGWMAMHTVLGAAIAIRPDRDPATAKAILTLRTPENPALRRDVAAQKQLIRDMLAGAGWHARLVLETIEHADDFYFDSLTRVDMPSLATGRVVLLGDAGYCGSPMTGMGTAMAIVGAYLLAGEIASTPGDLTGALARYEEKVTPFLATAKQMPGGGIKMMLPSSRVVAAMGRFSMRILTSPVVMPLTRKMFMPKDDGFELPVY